MSVLKIEENLKNLLSKKDHENFIYDFLLAFDQPKSTISRLRNGDYNLSSRSNELIWKKKLYYYHVIDNEDVHEYIDSISKNIIIKKNSIRFIVVTDFKDFLAIDTKSNETLDISFLEIPRNLNFFLPLTGVESFRSTNESPADRKAAVSFGKLYDQIIIDNGKLDLTDLNLFFSRLLFLYYADDANIFEKDLFLKTLKETTNENGNDLDEFFEILFSELNLENKENSSNHFNKFPYVNGNLFNEKIKIPKFSKKTREIIVNNAMMDWQNINPDILGSMLQAVLSPEEREEDEMHYTSVPNILKVIEPLFLDNINLKLSECSENETKLKNLLNYIYNIKIFDPACGSGNFLIISYIQLCLIEIKIFKILNNINPEGWRLSMPGISIKQFYGIEKSHYASETARLSLWIAEHQMKIKFYEVFGRINPSLPLSNNNNILFGNSASISWDNFCNFEKNTKAIFLIGNPPFKGFTRQTPSQKNDMKLIFKDLSGYKRLDYISLWFYKASEFIGNIPNSSCSFVSTNSISQGEHVNILWPFLLKKVEINFAVRSFKWGNNAKNNAVVSCVIIGLTRPNTKSKLIYDGQFIEKCKIINPYLTSGNAISVKKRENPFCKNFPRMIGGNMPIDNGYLSFTELEYNQIINKYPYSKNLFRKLTGGSEFLNGIKKWVLWIDDSNLNQANEIAEIKQRIENVRNYRMNAGDVARDLMNKPHQYRFRNVANSNFILVPYTSSIQRNYIPIGFLDKEFIALNSARVVFDPPLFMFSLLSSRLFLLWVINTSGKMENNIRFSTLLCYNTFPILEINSYTIKKLEIMSLNILDEREKFSDIPIGKLYGKNMPKSLIEIHKENDEIIEKFIFGKILNKDNEKIEMLFNLYKKCIEIDTLI